MSTIFSKIIRGEIPCHKIAEDDRFLAFLDVRPVKPGHTLVIPKQEVDYLFDLDDELLGGIMVFARPIAKAIGQVVPCAKVGVTVVGLEVRHAHVHLIPINGISDMNFALARAEDPEKLADMAAKIRALL
ncbi:MAG: HIT family protein [Kiritimatiellia bacterium]|jgi:histidine triad (HIT) family protein